MPAFHPSQVSTRASARRANVNIFRRRAAAFVGIGDRATSPPKLLPVDIDASKPVIIVTSGSAIVAWVWVEMAREAPVGLKSPTGYIRDISFPDNHEVQDCLLDACIAWFQDNDAKTIIGPMADSVMESRGLAYDQESSKGATYGLPVNPNYYIPEIVRRGFKVHMDMFEFEIPMNESTYSPKKLAERAKRAIPDCRIERLSGAEIADFLPQIVEVYNDAYADNDCFTPLLLSDLEPVANKMAKFLPHKSIVLIFSGERPIALSVGIPDFNKLSLTNPLALAFAQRAVANLRRHRGILFGVSRDFRGHGIEALVYEMFRDSLYNHCDELTIGWTVETNTPFISILKERLNITRIKKYALLRYDL